MDLNFVFSWIETNKLEVFGVISSLVYLYFSINRMVWLWPLGILSSALYVSIFFDARLYADMALSVYYVLISIYGWHYWSTIGSGFATKEDAVLIVNKKMWCNLALASVAVYGVFLAALLVLPVWLGMPSAAMPLLDALTTALGVVATWMLARRYLEQWLIWVFVDLLSAGMYFYKGLYPTAILFLVYTAMALVGYVAWKKEFISNSTGL
ncbi:MAG: hypothetical protein RIS47_1130 [Bacteroidota bacterium]|jgi:nicotinamide mononucleotide transporter